MSYIFTDYREITKASFFTKWNYSFDNRYLLEATVRTDGSSKFAPGNQWGFFPSASIGWNVHNESFMNSLKESRAINDLKLRASWGRIGNENVAPYLWEEVVNTWGWTMRVPNPEFTWEKQNQWNVGMDLVMLRNRFSLTADVYHKHSFDLIYSQFPVPPLTGSYYLETSVNIGEVENKGWKFRPIWSDKIGDFSYSIGGMIFDNKNSVLKAGYNPTDTLIFKELTTEYGIVVFLLKITMVTKLMVISRIKLRLMQQPQNSLTHCLEISNMWIRIMMELLMMPIESSLRDPAPHYNYSLSLDMRYKDWDFSLLGQGVGKRVGRLGGQEGFSVFVDGGSTNLGAPRQYYVDNRWTPETPNSRFPRVWTGTSTNTYLSDVWITMLFLQN